MTFKPLHSDHAIAEVVFTVILDRLITEDDARALNDYHASNWHAELPGSDGPPLGPELSIAAGGVRPIQYAFPVSRNGDPNLGRVFFSSFRRDGKIEWQLAAHGNQVVVNTAAYTRWERTWPVARHYLTEALKVLHSSARVVAHSLQYTNIFLWNGDVAAYDPALLLKDKSSLIPSHLLSRGPFWHSYAGWFEDPVSIGSSSSGAVKEHVCRHLRRMNVDGAQALASRVLPPGSPPDMPMIKMESFNRIDPYEILLSDQETDRIDLFFNYMHDANNKLLSDYITDDAANGIGLNG